MKKEYRCVLKTKNAIRKAFIELLYEKKSLEKISISELSGRANIAKSTFYNHYEDIYDVAEEFEKELIEQINYVFDEIEKEIKPDYEDYFRHIIKFLKNNEDTYHKVILSSDISFFIDKLKFIISKRVFENNKFFNFSQNKEEKYAQILFLANASVETIADYFKGNINLSIDEVGEVIIRFLDYFRRK